MTTDDDSTPAAIPPAGRPAVSPAPVPARAVDDPWTIDPSAVLAWSIVQVGVLALGLLQVPLAAKYPPGTSLAPYVLVAGQVGGAALLTPLLFRTAATALVVLASAWPALLLAGGMGARPAGDVALGAAAVSAWIVTLYLWSTCFRPSAARQVVAAVATLLAVGGALLGYLMSEFTFDAEPEKALPKSLKATPLLLVWDFIHDEAHTWLNAIPLGVLLLAGVVTWSVRNGWKLKVCDPPL